MTVEYSPEIDELATTATGLLVASEAVAQEAVANQLVLNLAALWATFSAFYDGDAVSEFGAKSASLVRAAQRRTGGITEQHLRRQYRRLGIELPPRIVELPGDLRLGADTVDVYQRPVRKLRYLVAELMDEEEAALIAAERLELQALTDLQLAKVTAAQQIIYAAPDSDAGVTTGWRRIIHPELGSVCGLCVAASDRVYQRIERMDLHPGCVTGDAPVRADGISVATRRWYSGRLVVLRTSTGKKLSITPNHPVLTDHGWVSAGQLQKGDRLVRYHGAQRPGGRSPDEEHAPASAENLWRALTVQGGLLPRAMPLAPEDLHGDGGHGEVDVVLVDRHLAPVGDTTFAQPCSELRFVDGLGRRSGLPAASSFDQLRVRPGEALGGRMSSRRDELAVFGSLFVAQQGSLTPGSQRDTSFDQATTYQRPGDVVVIGDRQFGFTSQVVLNQARGIDVAPTLTARFDPSGNESTVKGRGSYVELGRQLHERLSGEVELDEVVEVDVITWSGHVYNFQTREGWYDADSLVVSNCKCTVLPIVETSDGLVRDPGRVLNAADLTAIYAAAGDSTDSRRLSQTRVQIMENGELGQILMADGAVYKGPDQVKKQLSPMAAERRLASIQGQLDKLRAIERPTAWYLDRIEQLEELLVA